MDIEKAKKVFEKYINGKDTMKETLIKAIEVLLNELDKKEKIINAMAEQLAGLAIFDGDIEEATILEDTEQVIDYFTKKVTKED